MGAKTKAKHKDIARIDQESKRIHGWYVRVQFHGETKSKLFPDKKHKNSDSTLAVLSPFFVGFENNL